ncbi:MAG: hypothetical protein U0263_35870 [Polyangiaceae bacterium]
MPAPLRGLTAGLLIGLSACTVNRNPVRDAAADGLPAYTVRDAGLLDDRFSPELFGAIADSSEPTAERAKLAEGIARGRVVTVTLDSTGETEHFVVDLALVSPAVKGALPDEKVSLSVGAESPSFAFLKSVESGLVGTPVVLLYKRYNQGGQATLRWYVEAENQRVVGAIERARLMGELTH